MMKKLVFYALITIALLSVSAIAAPKPAIIQAQGDWTVDISFENPAQLIVKNKKSQKLERFWYTIVTLTNKTRNDVDFFPETQLMTNTLQMINAERDVTPFIFEQIKLRHQTKFPFLERLQSTSSKLLQGSDNTKDIAIIWPDFDKKAKRISIFISGLSNEIAVIDHPIEKDENGNPKKIILTKTLQIDYELAGDPAFRDNTKLVFIKKTWVMR